jgi:hypothetical protein
MSEALLAHGGTAGAIAESSIAIVVVGVFVAVWLRERSAHKSRENADLSERDD